MKKYVLLLPTTAILFVGVLVLSIPRTTLAQTFTPGDPSTKPIVSAPTTADADCRSNDAIITIPWTDMINGYELRPIWYGTPYINLPPFNTNVLSFKFTVPAGYKMPHRGGNQFKVYESVSPVAPYGGRLLSVSHKPCNFVDPVPTYRWLNVSASPTDLASRNIGELSVPFSVGLGEDYRTLNSGFDVLPGETFYINVKHDPRDPTCLSTNVDCKINAWLGQMAIDSSNGIDYGDACTSPEGQVLSIPKPGYPGMTESIFGKLCHRNVIVPDCDHFMGGWMSITGAGDQARYTLPSYVRKYCTDRQNGTDNVDTLKWSLVQMVSYAGGGGTTCPTGQVRVSGVCRPPTTGGGGTTVGGTTNSGPITITIGGSTITITPAAALGIIQSLANSAGVGSGVSVSPATTGGFSFTAGGVAFTANSTAELATLYANYLQGHSGNTSSGGGGGIPFNPPLLTGSLTVNMAPGDYNLPDQVKLLQTFLNSQLATGQSSMGLLPVNGFFDDLTLSAVKVFQGMHPNETYKKADPTATRANGFVGQYTRDLINWMLTKVN